MGKEQRQISSSSADFVCSLQSRVPRSVQARISRFRSVTTWRPLCVSVRSRRLERLNLLDLGVPTPPSFNLDFHVPSIAQSLGSTDKKGRHAKLLAGDDSTADDDPRYSLFLVLLPGLVSLISAYDSESSPW